MADTERYNAVAVFLHWSIALLILVMIPMGFFMDDLPIEVRFIGYTLHKSFGITILGLSVFRLIWRLMNPVPALPATMKHSEKLLAHAGHAAFYFLILAMPLSGWLMVSATPKYPTIFFWVVEIPFLPMPAGIDAKATHDWLQEMHELLTFGTLGLLVLHVGAALQHHYKLRDNVLRRMLPKWVQRA